jgi:hypothetical protein
MLTVTNISDFLGVQATQKLSNSSQIKIMQIHGQVRSPAATPLCPCVVELGSICYELVPSGAEQ